MRAPHWSVDRKSYQCFSQHLEKLIGVKKKKKKGLWNASQLAQAAWDLQRTRDCKSFPRQHHDMLSLHVPLSLGHCWTENFGPDRPLVWPNIAIPTLSFHSHSKKHEKGISNADLSCVQSSCAALGWETAMASSLTGGRSVPPNAQSELWMECRVPRETSFVLFLIQSPAYLRGKACQND